jgi:hypothetical protein
MVRLVYAGDMALVAMPDGGGDLFARVRRFLRGDVVLGNLEGTLTDGGSSKCGSGSSDCFAFHAPPSYARLFARAGFTVLNLANNHAYDFGAEGARETVAALDGAGIRHTGRPGEIAFVRVRGLRVALLGFAPYPWAQSLTDIRAAVRLVRYADAYADVVVATMHAGAEGADRTHVHPGTEWFLGENRGDAVAFAHAVVAAGADLVVGSGPHVVRGFEWYHGRLIAYSLGNFAGYRTLNVSGTVGLSGILEVDLRRDGGWAGGRLVPVRLEGSGTPVYDPSGATVDLVRTLSRDDFGHRGVSLRGAGVLGPPHASPAAP